jgi:hypothetical protein
MLRRRVSGGIVVWGLFLMLGATSCRAESNPTTIELEVVASGSSSVTTRKQALADLPLDQVAETNRSQVDELLKNVSIFRRMPTLKFVSEPEVYNYFLAHPDVAVSLWRVMEISNFELWQTGPVHYEADSRDGSTGTVVVLHSSPRQQLVLCEGSFKSPLLPKPIKARSLLHLQPSFQKRADGQTEVTHSLDMFVSFPSQPVDITAKLVSPVSHAMADRNFREVSLWVAAMNVGMARQPEWIEQLAGQMQGVLEQRRRELLAVAMQCQIASRRRELQRQVGHRELTAEELLALARQTAQQKSALKPPLQTGAVPASTEQPTAESSVKPALEQRRR